MLSRACCLALASRTALYMVLPMWNQFLSGVGGLKRHVLGTGAISYCKKTCQDWYNDQWLAHSPRFVSCLCSQELPVNHKTITYFSYYLVNFSVTFLKEKFMFFHWAIWMYTFYRIWRIQKSTEIFLRKCRNCRSTLCCDIYNNNGLIFLTYWPFKLILFFILYKSLYLAVSGSVLWVKK